MAVVLGFIKMVNNNNKLNALGSNIQQQIITNQFDVDPSRLTKTEMFDMLKSFMNSDLADSIELINTNPAEFNRKLVYNHVIKYRYKFQVVVNDQFRVGQIIEEDLTNSEPIVKKLSLMFYDVAIYEDDQITTGNGDKQLEEIQKKLEEVITCDPRIIESDITSEKITTFALALMAYGVMKCKVLLNPNLAEGENVDITR
ncbi:hypothetical protein [Lactobacillus koreensis] [Lactiplantibacillus mudanjiangensis]|uniref:Uncharacterized protein n=2 Tax=Lactiplantibacillus mudanjiangensis TaxID=1296538 RepID=A0A660DUR8_9LACO|nr:hypothetical protein [Lactobacillus koreensis] [Lactiplantibacillus mudanjiangensis]VDG26751.1 hypothetical protein [Lactobacillus koreensis] [Lactiplantibacillus mudanjiangensis]